MRAIVTGGGTGGHIYPALAIADKIKEKDSDAEILYVGNDIGLEKDIVPGSGYPMELVSAKWLDRSNIFKIFDTGFSTMKGVRQSMKIMKKFKPDVVIGTGGFVCVPVIYAGHKYGARCFLHEQNAYPGVANKTLEKFVEKVFMGFPEAAHYFKEPEKHVVSGNPVRTRFSNVDRKKAREKLGLAADDFVVFSFGGSQGAQKINDVVFELMKYLNDQPGKVLFYGTGSQYYDEVLNKIKAEGIQLGGNIRIESYINNMEDYLGASDLVISRAGALSVAETCTCGRASILVPSPNVTGNHQYFNAKSVADRGGAILIEEKDFTGEKLIEEVRKLENDPELLKQMGEASLKCAPSSATEIIYSNICKGNAHE